MMGMRGMRIDLTPRRMSFARARVSSPCGACEPQGRLLVTLPRTYIEKWSVPKKYSVQHGPVFNLEGNLFSGQLAGIRARASESINVLISRHALHFLWRVRECQCPIRWTTRVSSHLCYNEANRAGDRAMAMTEVRPDNRKTKGPLVWMDMDQTELDNAYDQAVYAPNQPLVHARRAAANSARHGAARRAAALPVRRERDRERRRLPRQAPRTRRSTCIIHGGAWRNGRSRRLRGAGRDDRQRRRAQRDRRLQQCRRRRRQPDDRWPSRCAAPSPGSTRTPTELRRRSEPALRHRPFVGRASGGLHRHLRLGEGFRPAEGHREGRDARLRHV